MAIPNRGAPPLSDPETVLVHISFKIPVATPLNPGTFIYHPANPHDPEVEAAIERRRSDALPKGGEDC